MDAAQLSEIELLKGLPDADLAALAGACVWKRYAKGQTVIAENDDDNDVCFIIFGQARATVYASTGMEIIFRDIGPGDFFGEYSAIDQAPRSAFVVALDDTLIAKMPAATFVDAVTRHAQLAERIMHRFVRQIRGLSERVFEFSALAVKYRIHRELLRMAEPDRQGGPQAIIAPAPTQADIASRISTHREAVSRELSALGRAGIIERKGHDLVIPDLRRLQQLVDEAFSATA